MEGNNCSVVIWCAGVSILKRSCLSWSLYLLRVKLSWSNQIYWILPKVSPCHSTLTELHGVDGPLPCMLITPHLYAYGYNEVSKKKLKINSFEATLVYIVLQLMVHITKIDRYYWSIFYHVLCNYFYFRIMS